MHHMKIFTVLFATILVASLACGKTLPYHGTPPPELIEFRILGEDKGTVLQSFKVAELSSKDEIYKLGKWLLRYEDVDVFYWIYRGDMAHKHYENAYRTALVSRRVDGVSTNLEEINDWKVCDDLGYVIWYKGNYPVESINTDGDTEMYNISSVGQYRSGGIPLDERCDYQ